MAPRRLRASKRGSSPHVLVQEIISLGPAHVPHGHRAASIPTYDSELLQDAIDSFSPCRVPMKRFYRYQRSGWQIAEEAAVRDSQFVVWSDPRPRGS
jgi:hypothetical protein